MLAWFRPNSKKRKITEEQTLTCYDGYFSPQSLSQLLAGEKRQQALKRIWQNSSLPEALYERLYRAPLDETLSLMQQLPMNENEQYAYSGGLIDYTLKVVLYAMKLSKSYLLPLGGMPEDISSQSSVWNAVIF